jgi:hypothetical protein
MAINIQTATVQELRDERKRISDRIRKGGLTAGQLRNAERNIDTIRQQLTTLQQTTQEVPTEVIEENLPVIEETTEETTEEIGDGSIAEPPVNVVNPNDVNNNGIPDNIEAAQLQVAAGERAEAERRRLFLEDAATNKKTAIDVLRESIKVYFTQSGDESFVTELSAIIDDYARQGFDSATISVLLPQTVPYQTRFSGNKGRLAAGLSALSPRDYIDAENNYNEILTRFNLKDLSKRNTFSSLISGQVSAAELTDRVVNVYDRIRNADPALRAELNRVESLGGNITDADFAKALLTGTEGANELKRKISTAEITAEARIRQLGVGSAAQLQQLGVTREQARAGFETIAQAQPTFEKLAGIYDREALTPQASQTELEQEVFQGMASERRKRLVQREQASFSGESGISGSALSTQRAGQI